MRTCTWPFSRRAGASASALAANNHAVHRYLVEGVPVEYQRADGSLRGDLIRHFIVFEYTGGGVLVKKMAGYHQYHAVNVAVEETVRACVPGDEPLRISAKRGTYLSRPLRDAQPGDRRNIVVIADEAHRSQYDFIDGFARHVRDALPYRV